MGVAMNANTKDVSAGLLFIAIAALFALGTQELELGTARRLGPGAFPLMLSGVLGLLGLIILVKGFRNPAAHEMRRSEEHTSELQSQSNLVCRLLLEKKHRDRATP